MLISACIICVRLIWEVFQLLLFFNRNRNGLLVSLSKQIASFWNRFDRVTWQIRCRSRPMAFQWNEFKPSVVMAARCLFLFFFRRCNIRKTFSETILFDNSAAFIVSWKRGSSGFHWIQDRISLDDRFNSFRSKHSTWRYYFFPLTICIDLISEFQEDSIHGKFQVKTITFFNGFFLKSLFPKLDK